MYEKVCESCLKEREEVRVMKWEVKDMFTFLKSLVCVIICVMLCMHALNVCAQPSLHSPFQNVLYSSCFLLLLLSLFIVQKIFPSTKINSLLSLCPSAWMFHSLRNLLITARLWTHQRCWEFPCAERLRCMAGVQRKSVVVWGLNEGLIVSWRWVSRCEGLSNDNK